MSHGPGRARAAQVTRALRRAGIDGHANDSRRPQAWVAPADVDAAVAALTAAGYTVTVDPTAYGDVVGLILNRPSWETP